MQQKLYNFGVYSPLKRTQIRKLIKTNIGGMQKMAKENKTNNEEWKKIEADIFKFENEGDVIEGILIDVDESSNYNNKVYKIEKADGKTSVVFGTTVLDTNMKNVSLGTHVRILFIGTKPNNKVGQNDIKLFEVFVKNI